MKKQLSPHTRVRLLFRNGKKVRAHRWIMEQHIGRELSHKEHIHHINGNPLDNTIENLRIINHKEHMNLHKQKYPDMKNCVHCGKTFKVNPRKRKRNKCCGQKCAQEMRVIGILKQHRSQK